MVDLRTMQLALGKEERGYSFAVHEHEFASGDVTASGDEPDREFVTRQIVDTLFALVRLASTLPSGPVDLASEVEARLAGKAPTSPRFRHAAAFAEWIRRLLRDDLAPGSTLIDYSAMEARGRWVTQPADCDADLLTAEAAGWIERESLCPTKSQRAWLGLQYADGSIPQGHASCWRWARGGNADAMRTWLGEWVVARSAAVARRAKR